MADVAVLSAVIVADAGHLDVEDEVVAGADVRSAVICIVHGRLGRCAMAFAGRWGHEPR